ncbi:MAG: grasp-with-spasm system ATP-grasp peptide maturase [Sediminibacterium sp.]|nr:grasp-with-spasm system ATP-grasp peptide maturase [Sediminibacterium sp.]
MNRDIIFVLSQSYDPSTDDVLKWMKYFSEEKRILRISEKDIIQVLEINISTVYSFKLLITFTNQTQLTISSDEIFSYWYRRSYFQFGIRFSRYNNEFEQKFLTALYEFNTEESLLVKKSIDQFLYNNFVSVNKFEHVHTSKIDNIRTASKLGLKVPPSLLTSNGTALKSFIDCHTKVICKPFKDYIAKFDFEGKEIHFGYAPTIIEKKDLEVFFNEPNFHLSFFQAYIEKRYELRVFYFHGSFYTMAIFSQNNEKTKVDFRNYDYDTPNRIVPFKLPKTVEKLLDTFMHTIQMNSGSIDMILTPEKEFVFLEVNPIGQFQWLSHHCNYYIEKQIAKKLVYENREKTVA